MNRGEAELVMFWQDFFSGQIPALLRGVRHVGPEGVSALRHDLVRAAVRTLLEQGGAAPDVSIVDDRRINQRNLWTEPHLTLDLGPPLLPLLVDLATTGRPGPQAQPEPTDCAWLGIGGEVILLRIADVLAARPRADMNLRRIVTRGTLATLVHLGTVSAHGWPKDSSFDDGVFFLRGRLARGWLALDPILRAEGQSPHITTVLSWADDRRGAWCHYRAHVLATRRYDLLAPMCTAMAALWSRVRADQLIARFEGIGRFPGERERQEAYRRLLGAYEWLADLELLAAQARRASRSDEDFELFQVVLAHLGHVDSAKRAETGRLLTGLRQTL